MANTYKNIVITPNRDTGANVVPVIRFSGGDTTSNTDINVRVYTTQSGTLSFEGSAGQLFSITNDLTNTIFSVNDVSGIPSIEVNANGTISMAEFGGNLVIGRANSTVGLNTRLDVAGAVNASAFLVNGTAVSTSGTAFATKTANYTSVNGDRLLCNTTAGTFIITLPATPTSGATVLIYDIGNFTANPLTVARNASTIEFIADDFSLDIGQTRNEFVYDGSTWHVYSSIGPRGLADTTTVASSIAYSIALG